MRLYLNGDQDEDQFFEGGVLIMPSSNTVHDFGQLVIDTLLYNYDFKNVGHLHSEYVIPVAGYIESTTKHNDFELVSGLELYRYASPVSQKNFFVVQIRTRTKKVITRLSFFLS